HPRRSRRRNPERRNHRRTEISRLTWAACLLLGWAAANLSEELLQTLAIFCERSRIKPAGFLVPATFTQWANTKRRGSADSCAGLRPATNSLRRGEEKAYDSPPSEPVRTSQAIRLTHSGVLKTTEDVSHSRPGADCPAAHI